MASGNDGGWAQRWSGGVPTWVHTSQGGFDRRRYEVVELAEAPAREYIQANHYLSGWPPAVHRFGLVDLQAAGGGDGQVVDGHLLVGVVVLGVPMSRLALTRVFPSLEPYSEALEMSRVCLSPSVASNGESFAVAAALRLAAGHGVRGVVTYADPVARLRTLPDGRTAGSPHGHLGVIYQALSATYTGRSSARTVTVLPDGQVLPARSIAKFVAGDRGADGFERRIRALGATARPAGADRRTWLRTALEQIGARRQRHPGTHKYALAVGRNRGERSRAVFGMPALPYPKWEADRRPSGAGAHQPSIA
ncbi:Mom family adenine methylcarbamoylation protein [Streptomyces griseoaurantiacus]|uniref:Mom family adenine methylcarbamoylation protein n=1 Tax=Streptomyces griseoaurantiacus TaxID=68213 RepID=UPI003806DE22